MTSSINSGGFMATTKLWRSVVVFVVALAVAVPNVQAAQKGSGAKRTTEAAFTLREDMRKLWTDHVVWTRDYIIAAVADQPDATAAAGRLMKNQEDIGQAVASYYGAAAGAQLTALLKQHISIAVDLIKAAKAGDKAGQQA